MGEQRKSPPRTYAMTARHFDELSKYLAELAATAKTLQTDLNTADAEEVSVHYYQGALKGLDFVRNLLGDATEALRKKQETISDRFAKIDEK